MFQRVKAVIIVSAILSADFYICNAVFGMEPAFVVTGILLIYGFWIGEIVCLRSVEAIPVRKIKDEYARERLENCFKQLKEEVGNNIGYRIACKVCLIPEDSLNAYAYGRTIGITEGALNCLDESTVKAVLAHEFSHIICLDPVINRLIFSHIVMIMSILALTHSAVIGVVFLLIFALCLLGMKFNMITFFVTKGILSVIKKVSNVFRFMVLSLLQMFMALLSRRCEFRADAFSCKLGYAYELEYFLERFTELKHKRTLQEVLYDHHPSSGKRIKRIESYIDRKIQLPITYHKNLY